MNIPVIIPGPWWTQLTYSYPETLTPGTRVRVKLAGSSRVGIAAEPPDKPDETYGGKIYDVSEIIDDEPILPPFVMPLLGWFGDTYLCGPGLAAKTLLPAEFIKGTPLGADAHKNLTSITNANCDNHPDDTFIYEPSDAARWERYAKIISDGKPTLICFPLYDTAKAFEKKRLVGVEHVRFPRSSAKAEWRAWGDLLGGGASLVVGGQTAAMAPLPGLARIIIEDESNSVWRTVRHPVFNARSLLAKRARIGGAQLILGGRMPSARAFMRAGSASFAGGKEDDAVAGAGKNFYFVDMKMAYSPAVGGVSDTIAVSEPLVRETETAIDAGTWALWILDRKGYAGEIACDECGWSPKCDKCGGAMRWEASLERLSCVACKGAALLPDACPKCGSRLLSAKRPGLEALLPLARSAVNSTGRIFLLDGEIPASELKARSGLIIGTRAALDLCDRVHVGMAGWIDADADMKSRERDASERAFSLVWESRWRGLSPEKRVVVIQTRRPCRGWQRGLESERIGAPAWAVFWRGELRERKELSMPPFKALVKITASAEDTRGMEKKFVSAGLEYWIDDNPENSGTIRLRVKDTAALRRELEPFFSIKRARQGFPSVTVWYE
ncbi:primosomal protein N' [Synergistales bacterium]|nr:primosomal protein N' [Synergistales bacterium]